MKKADKTEKDELRTEYKLSDFPEGLIRGKYAKRIKKSSNIVVLKPEVAEVFPNEDAVNKALLSLIELARKATHSIPILQKQSGWVKLWLSKKNLYPKS
jgi:hypothetical protein